MHTRSVESRFASFSKQKKPQAFIVLYAWRGKWTRRTCPILQNCGKYLLRTSSEMAKPTLLYNKQYISAALLDLWTPQQPPLIYPCRRGSSTKGAFMFRRLIKSWAWSNNWSIETQVILCDAILDPTRRAIKHMSGLVNMIIRQPEASFWAMRKVCATLLTYEGFHLLSWPKSLTCRRFMLIFRVGHRLGKDDKVLRSAMICS